MTDEKLVAQWALLEPGVQQQRTIERRVFAWLEAGDTSLAAQWIAMFRIRPVAVLGFATVNALTLLPLSWLRFAAFP